MDQTLVLLSSLGAYVAGRFGLAVWRDRRSKRIQAEARAAGEGVPATLTPWVDPTRCVCSAQCVRVCPEADVLRVIGGRAQLVNAAACVGHARCVAACPTQAIELVFGSDARGVEVPRLRQDFETNVRGLYVAGELGGMGLIANAVTQGAAAARAALASAFGAPEDADVLIVGAGPAGIAAALAVKEAGGRYLLIEQEDWGGAIRHYPRQHLVMTRDVHFPGYGVVTGRTMSKDELIALLDSVLTSEGIEVQEQERLESLRRDGDGFRARTSRRTVRVGRVVLAVGRRGSPRRLEVPGEELAKVQYVLRDADGFVGEDILVVGGGDSALQAAVALAEGGRNRVTLSYRGASFTRPKAANIERVQATEGITVLFDSVVQRIQPDAVELRVAGEVRRLPNQRVFAMTGGVLPTDLLERMGVEVELHFGREVRFF